MHTTIRIQSYTYIHAYMHEFIHKNKPPLSRQRRQSGLKSGGSWIRVKKFDFLGKFRCFHKEKIDFLWQISEKFRFLTDDFTKIFTFFKANFQRISIFLDNFTKNFDFLKKIPKISIFSGNFTKNFDFLGHFTKSFDFLRKFAKSFYFFRQFKKIDFFKANFQKISIFYAISQKISICQA